MSIRVEKTIIIHIGNGITAVLTRELETSNNSQWDLQIEWANGEEALDYSIGLDVEAMSRLSEAFSVAINELKERNN